MVRRTAIRKRTKSLKHLSLIVVFSMFCLIFMPVSHANVDSVGPTHNVHILWKTRVFNHFLEAPKKMAVYKNYLIIGAEKIVKVFDTKNMFEVGNFNVPWILDMAVYKGIIYILGSGNGLYAYNMNGALLWYIKSLPAIDYAYPPKINISPKGIFVWGRLISSIHVIWISFSGKIKLVWGERNFHGGFFSSILYDDNIYILTVDFKASREYIQILNAETNSTKNISLPNVKWISQMSIDNDGTLYALGFDLSGKIILYTWDKNLQVRWKFIYSKESNISGGSIGIGNGVIYILLYHSDSSPILLTLEKNDGRLIKSFLLKHINVGYIQKLVDRDNNLYFLFYYSICSYSPTGYLNWKINITDDFNSHFIISGGYLYLFTYFGNLYKIGTPSSLPVVVVGIFIGGLIILGVWKCKKLRKNEQF